MPSYDFSVIKDDLTRTAIEIGYKGAVEKNLIEFFKTAVPPKEKGYMFWDAPELQIIAEWYEAHNFGLSGATFAWCCRILQAFFKNPEEVLANYKYAN
jgi:hypothetical protein